ncbi:MAG: sodium:solute symporter family protein [Deltaproteobacteria bacterium]|nr:sodium:solute symporter family protein [Deltaproteobacteria bacterium]MBW2419656.1 sodium:solute symporter family protein [Deltaproteobacteria bacterium]
MSLEVLGVVAVVVYLVALLVVAEAARRARRDDSPSDHFLAARELGTPVLFLTLYATAYSGNSLLGYPGRAYVSGFSFVMATGFMLSIVVVFHALVPRLRPLAVVHAFVTPGDWIRHRFGVDGLQPGRETGRAATALATCVGLLMTLALLNFLLAQLKAMGHVASIMTGDLLPYEVGVVGLAGLILLYETRGGMRAVAWTDAAQGVLMLFGLAALLSWLLGQAGGVGGVTRAVAAVRPEAVAVPDARSCASWFSTIVLLGLASVIYPQAIQRIYAARDARALRRSFALMSFMPLVTTLVVTLIGLAAIPRLQGLERVATDEVMPRLLGQWAEGGGGVATAGAVLVFVGVLAAIMSTADSCLLSLGSLTARDLLPSSARGQESARRGKWLAALLLLAMVPLALWRELTLWRLIELKMELLIQCVPAFLLALHWRGLRAAPTLAGLVAGTCFGVGFTVAGIPRMGGIHVGVLGLAVNLAVAVAGSLLPPRSGGASGAVR